MTTKSTPPPDSDDSIALPHPEHDEITAAAVIAWRGIAETFGLPINGPDACEAIDIIIHSLYNQRGAGLEFTARLLSDLSTHEDATADECRGDAVNFSAERIALARERSAAYMTAGAIVFRHSAEMMDDHVHFDESKSMEIEKMSDELTGNSDPEDDHECEKSN